MPPITGRSGVCARRARTAHAGLVTALAAAAALAAPAAAQGQARGGAEADLSPVVDRVSCRAACEGGRIVAGSTVALKGERLGAVAAVTFLGSASSGDEITVTPGEVTARRVLAVVPAEAVRGRAIATDVEGTPSPPSPVVRIAQPVALRRSGGPIATAVISRRAFFGARRRPTVAYQLQTARPAQVTVQVVREADGAVVKTADEGVVAPGERRAYAWNGRGGGAAQPDGRYAFVVVARDAESGLRATSAQSRAADSFTLLGHRFPVRGPHDYGEYAASFGGGRGHQGHDVFAACGTPVVAARGGVVKMKRSHERAGNYVVIDGAGTGVDHAYMHLRDPALVEQRERVRTGQLIGYVGDTGRASGCHLHFEAWSAPGWYTGGSPFDPLPDLLAWDRVS